MAGEVVAAGAADRSGADRGHRPPSLLRAFFSLPIGQTHCSRRAGFVRDPNAVRRYVARPSQCFGLP